MRALAVGILAAVAGCGDARPVVGGARACLTFKDDIAPELIKRCVACHPAGAAYDVTTYLTTLTDRTGQPIAIAGDSASPLLRALADVTHARIADLAPAAPLFQRWVVECDLAYERSIVHEAGILNPADPAFHGDVIRSIGWNLETCAACHGSDFSGGTSGASCRGCHEGGPAACTTCHGAPPATGAHLAHQSGAIMRALDCSECHLKPTVYTDVGHLRDARGGLIARATVTLGAFAQTTPAGARPLMPAFDAATKQCQNVYCHGAAFADTQAKQTTPAWYGGPPDAACGSCHGLPPSSHTSHLPCADCHQGITDAGGLIVDRSRHIDGKVSFAPGQSGCTSCHGQPPATGAHVAHATAQHGLSAPVACADCHAVPALLDSPGHLDDVVTVFPAGGSGLAYAGGSKPSWNGASCATVYCHGSSAPTWSGGTSQALCGSCHGIPPADAPHVPTMGLQQCAVCHPKTMDASGAIIASGGMSAHINGVVDGQ